MECYHYQLGLIPVLNYEGFQQTYEYALYYEGTVKIRVDGEPFATGEIRGCAMTYESGNISKGSVEISDGKSKDEPM